MGRRRRPRSRVIVVDRDRFSAGWRLLPEPGFELPPIAPSPDLVVDVIRPVDQLVVTVEGYDVELVVGARPRIRPKPGGTRRLVVRLASQHLAERAIYESAAPIPDEDDPTNPPEQQPAPPGEPAGHSPPIPARPARSSRLVFEVPIGEEIP